MSTTTDDEIDAAILAALAPTGEELVSWARIDPLVPGGFWPKAQAVLRLHEEGEIYLTRTGGRAYVGLGDDADRLLAAAAKARGRVRGVRVV